MVTEKFKYRAFLIAELFVIIIFVCFITILALRNKAQEKQIEQLQQPTRDYVVGDSDDGV